MEKGMRAVAASSVITLAVAGATVTGLSGRPAASYSGPCQAVFVSPHQDDEVLSMGAAVRQHVEEFGGDKVCAVLFTTGLHSVTRTVIRGGTAGPITYAGWLPSGTSSPVSHPSLTDDQFIAARDAEFVAALQALGVPSSNIYVNGYTLNGVKRRAHTQNTIPGVERVYDDNDGNAAQKARASAFMDAVVRYFGSGKDYKTQSPSDPSGDHAALGLALQNTSLTVRSKRYYYPPYQRSLPNDDRLTLTEQKATNSAALLNAAKAYGVYDPSHGRYGIGWLSVSQPFGGDALSVQTCVKDSTNTVSCNAPTPAYPSASQDTSFIGNYVSLVQTA